MAYTQDYPGSRYGDLYNQYPKPKPFNPVDEIGPALDTTNARPSLNTAVTKTLGSLASPQPQSAAVAQSTPGVGSPELAGLVHSIQTPVTSTVAPTTPAPVPASVSAPAPGVAPVAAAPVAATTPAAPAIPAYLQPLIDAIPGLMNPMTMESPEMVAQANQLTRANQRGTDIAAEQLREKMGGATGGLVTPGESGLADTAIGSIYRGGATDTATQLGELARTLPGLNLSRMLAGSQLGGQVGGFDLSQQGLTYQQQQDALNMLMQMYGGEQGYQQAQWSPYYSGIVGAYGG
jgi:hypothetical protein